MERRTRVLGIALIAAFIIGLALIAYALWDGPTGPTPATPTAAVQVAATPGAPGTAIPTAAVRLTPTAPPTPETYVVQGGDTLSAIAYTYGVSLEALMAANGIADPNVLHVGQELLIPTASPAPAEPPATEVPSTPAEPVATPVPTVTPIGPPLVEIAQVLGAGDLSAERVVIRNRGGPATVEGWTLADAEGNAFVFPALTLFPQAEARVHSRSGTHTPRDLYWGRVAPAWNGGELLTLSDAQGQPVDTYIVP
jgi:LysM repeat protein